MRTQQFGLNVVLGMVWMFLHTSYTFIDFAVGYILGAVLIYLLAHLMVGRPYYLDRFFKLLKLVAIFMRELVIACLQVLFHVLRPKINIRPGIIKMQIYLEKPAQITLLANMITLTPGTMTVEVASDNTALYIHTLDIDDADKICRDIEENFEKNILEVWGG